MRNVVGESRRAVRCPQKLAPGTAMRIFTGAPTPEGTTAVVMQEQTERDGDSLRLTATRARAITSVIGAKDVKEGALAIARGTLLRPNHVPMLAHVRGDRPECRASPVVAVLAQRRRAARAADLRGQEPSSRPTPMIAAMARREGAEVRVLPIAPDDPNALQTRSKSALVGADVVFTIGGVSVGDHDLVAPRARARRHRARLLEGGHQAGQAAGRGSATATRTCWGCRGNCLGGDHVALFGAPLIRGSRVVPTPCRARHARPWSAT